MVILWIQQTMTRRKLFRGGWGVGQALAVGSYERLMINGTCLGACEGCVIHQGLFLVFVVGSVAAVMRGIEAFQGTCCHELTV